MRGARSRSTMAWALSFVAASVLAGCVAPVAEVQPLVLDPVAASDLKLETWNGTILVGAASELPAHFPETAPLVAPLWPKNMRNVEFVEVPRSFVVRMNWTGAPGTQVQLMVEAPAQDGTVHLFTAPGAGAFTSDATLCVPVPPDALVEGHWKVMPHTRAGADVAFSISIELAGGEGGYTAHMEHWQTASEFATRFTSGRIVDHPAEPCE